MKRSVSLILIAALCLSLASCVPNLKKYSLGFAEEKADLAEIDMQSPEYLDFIGRVTSFSLKLSELVCADLGESRNFVLSPAAVYMTLAVAAECASGQTREEILGALGSSYSEIEAMTRYLYAVCNEEYSSTTSTGKQYIKAYEKLSSSVWIDSDLAYRRPTVGTLTSIYNCDVYAAPFSNGNAGKMINQYIEYKTNGFIDGNAYISNKSDISFISTFYLSEVWNELGRGLSSTFDQYNFKSSDGGVKRMHLLQSNYSAGKVFKTSSYSSFYAETVHGYKVFFILPYDGVSIPNVMNVKNLSRVLDLKNYRTTDSSGHISYHTRVLFPDFSVSFGEDLEDILSDGFGIRSLFDSESCDLSGLIDGASIYCKDLVHRAELKLDAKGVCDASQRLVDSSAASMIAESEEQYSDFVVDRSFAFVLTDTHGNILYIGAMNDIDK